MLESGGGELWLPTTSSAGMLTFTPAGGIGKALWEGEWQVALPGRRVEPSPGSPTRPEPRRADEKVRAPAIGSDGRRTDADLRA
jgi:hypothetical protein